MKGKSTNLLFIGEPTCADAIPFFHPLKNEFKHPSFRFVPGTPTEMNLALERGELDAGLTSSIVFARRPYDFLLLPGYGIATRGAIRSILFFSDFLLDDIDEMTVSLSSASESAAAVMRIVLTKYLQYNVDFKTGWGEADGFLLIGDAALRERSLQRYNYVYDVGELWRHYTDHSMVFATWIVRRTAAEQKPDLVQLLKRSIQHSINSFHTKPEALLSGAGHLNWLPQQKLLDHWAKIHYELSPNDLAGLNQFYKDLQDIEEIENVPSLEFFED